MAHDRVKISKLLSLVLRHEPETIGLSLDAQGWTSVDDLIARANAHGNTLTREILAAVVATSDKQRFALSSDGSRIRANQGHSVGVDLGLAVREPPSTLFHGTADRFLASIRAQGLVRGSRHHVHLSRDEATAVVVGSRHGRPVILNVQAGRMHAAGHVFHLTDNGVWLTDAVPPEFIDFPKDAPT